MSRAHKAIIVSVTRDQHRQIKRQAKAARCTMSDYIRVRLELLDPALVGPAPSVWTDPPFDGGPAPEAKP